VSTELALAEARTDPPITLALAKALAPATWLPDGMRNRPADVLLAMLTGRELGIGPMTALRVIYIVEGTPTIKATMQLALLRRRGHKVEEIVVTPLEVRLRGTHGGTGDVVEATYTMAEAEAVMIQHKSGPATRLVDKSNWKSYGADMIYSRCCARLARRLDETATGAIYSPADFGVSDAETTGGVADAGPVVDTGVPDGTHAGGAGAGGPVGDRAVAGDAQTEEPEAVAVAPGEGGATPLPSTPVGELLWADLQAADPQAAATSHHDAWTAASTDLSRGLLVGCRIDGDAVAWHRERVEALPPKIATAWRQFLALNAERDPVVVQNTRTGRTEVVR